MLRNSIFAIFAIFLGAQSAAAQFSFGESEAPIFIKAEKATYKGNMTLLEGDVDVRQGSARIRSAEMEIYREKSGDESEAPLQLGAVTEIVATGNFVYNTADERVSGDKGIYNREKQTIIVTGNVRVGQEGQFRLRGDRLVYDLQTKRARVGKEGERVNITIE